MNTPESLEEVYQRAVNDVITMAKGQGMSTSAIVNKFNYVRTSGSRNKLNKRGYKPFEPTEGAMITGDGRRYLRAEDGALVRTKRKGEK